MRFYYNAPIIALGLSWLGFAIAAAADFALALDLMMQHHGKDKAKLGQTLNTLTQIATKLRDEPGDEKYQSIRLLNKTFWDRVGSVNGGISFMNALGFDLVQQGQGQGPAFQVRPGAPQSADLALALELLSGKSTSRSSQQEPAAPQEHVEDEGVEATGGAAMASGDGGREGFNPFATAFSRRSRTHLQQRAEEGLANWARRQAMLQQRFGGNEERNVTILLPPAAAAAASGVAVATTNSAVGEDSREGDDELNEREELEIALRLWRERHTRDEPERFETRATRELRKLLATKIYPYVIVRVRLPEGLYVQARFNLDESLKTVYQVIGKSLEAEARSQSDESCSLELCHHFELFLAGPARTLEHDSTSLRDANILAPACLVHLRWDDEQTVAESWGSKLENGMAKVMTDARHPRVPYSSRYDVPEPVSSRRMREAAERNDDAS